jgi:hypothetical protein
VRLDNRVHFTVHADLLEVTPWGSSVHALCISLIQLDQGSVSPTRNTILILVPMGLVQVQRENLLHQRGSDSKNHDKM